MWWIVAALAVDTASAPRRVDLGAGEWATAAPARGDVDGDGRPELAVRWTHWLLGDYVSVISAHGPGLGTTDVLIGNAVTAWGLTDTNGDGYDDLIVSPTVYAPSPPIVRVYTGSSAGLDTTRYRDVVRRDVLLRVLPDLDGDGAGELLLGTTTGLTLVPGSNLARVNLLEATLGVAITSGAAPTTADAYALGDVTGDRRLDLVWTQGSPQRVWVLPDLARVLTQRQAVNVATAGFGVDLPAGQPITGGVPVGDLDLDGRAEVVLASPAGGSVWLWTPAGTALGAVRPVAQAAGRWTWGQAGVSGLGDGSVAALRDRTGDRRPELLVPTWSTAGDAVKMIDTRGALPGPGVSRAAPWAAPAVTAVVGHTFADEVGVYTEADLDASGRPDIIVFDTDRTAGRPELWLSLF